MLAMDGGRGQEEQEHKGFLGSETMVSSCDTMNYE